MTINDNFGKLLARLIRSPSTGADSNFIAFFDTGNIIRGLGIYALAGNFVFNFTSQGAGLSKTRVGDGTTPPTRQDFTIDNGFPDSPESALQSSVTPTFNSGLGKITQATLISPTGGSGTVKEVIKTARWARAIGGGGDFLISRNIVPDKSFVIAESINLDHEVLI